MSTLTAPQYKVINGTSYHSETPDRVIDVLETVRASRTRIRVYYGNREPYKNWNEEHDIRGYIGRSIGSVKIPLLVYNSRSMGGGGILDDCILKIVDTKSKNVLYQYENYVNPVIKLMPNEGAEKYTHSLWVEGDLYSNHESLEEATRLLKKLI